MGTGEAVPQLWLYPRATQLLLSEVTQGRKLEGSLTCGQLGFLPVGCCCGLEAPQGNVPQGLLWQNPGPWVLT